MRVGSLSIQGTPVEVDEVASARRGDGGEKEKVRCTGVWRTDMYPPTDTSQREKLEWVLVMQVLPFAHPSSATTPLHHPGGNPVANLKSISYRCRLILVAFVWELTEEIIDLPLGCLQGGVVPVLPAGRRRLSCGEVDAGRRSQAV